MHNYAYSQGVHTAYLCIISHIHRECIIMRINRECIIMHIHRECIIETKWKYDVAPEDKQLAFKQMIINFIEVNLQHFLVSLLFTIFELQGILQYTFFRDTSTSSALPHTHLTLVLRCFSHYDSAKENHCVANLSNDLVIAKTLL